MINATNANEREIKRRVDLKAQPVPGSNVNWDSINFEMKLTLPFVMSASDEKFLDEYVKWVQGHHSLSKSAIGL
jgi:hypothetical protein